MTIAGGGIGVPTLKDDTGSEAASPKGAVQQAVRLLKKKLPELDRKSVV